MRSWTLLLAGPILWAIHFFALYSIASIFLTTMLARVLTMAVTLACLAAGVPPLVRILRSDTSTALGIWMRAVALGGIGLGGVAILWQALPALIA